MKKFIIVFIMSLVCISSLAETHYWFGRYGLLGGCGIGTMKVEGEMRESYNALFCYKNFTFGMNFYGHPIGEHQYGKGDVSSTPSANEIDFGINLPTSVWNDGLNKWVLSTIFSIGGQTYHYNYEDRYYDDVVEDHKSLNTLTFGAGFILERILVDCCGFGAYFFATSRSIRFGITYRL